MKVDQVILEQLDAALNGSASSGSGKGNGEFAAVLDKALGSETGGNGKNAVVPKDTEGQLMTDEKEPESGSMESADLEEKLELLMLSLLQSDQAALEKFAAGKEQQNGQPMEEKIIAALKGDKISAEVLKEELAVKIEQQVKQESGLKVKNETLAKNPEAEASKTKGETKGETKNVTKNETKGETKGEVDLKAKKAFAQNEALLKEKAVKAQNADKTNESGKNAEKSAVSKKGFPGEIAEKQADLKGKASELQANRTESAGKKPEQAVKGNREEAESTKGSAEQSSDKNTEQNAAARANNARQDTGLNPGRSESSRAEANTQRPQSVSPAQEQNIAQQSTIRGDEALQGNRVLNAQNANVRESVMQQLQGRMTYLRESGNNPAEMRVTLHPPELGEVTVRVFSSKGRLSASIIAETPLAREILESSITELRQRMNFVNIQFDQLDVSTAGKEHEGFDRSGDREGSGKAEFGEAEGDEKRSAESEPPPQQMPPDDSGSGIDFWA